MARCSTRIAAEATDMFRSMTFPPAHWRTDPDHRPLLVVSYEIP